MTTFGCRISKVRLKGSSSEIVVFPNDRSSVITCKYPFGEVTFRMYDGKHIEPETALWLLECAREKLLYGRFT